MNGEQTKKFLCFNDNNEFEFIVSKSDILLVERKKKQITIHITNHENISMDLESLDEAKEIMKQLYNQLTTT